MWAKLARPAKISVVVALAVASGAVSDQRGDRVAWPLLCTSPAHAFESEASGVFHGAGVVKVVDSAKGWLTLDHERSGLYACDGDDVSGRIAAPHRRSPGSATGSPSTSTPAGT